MSARTKRASVSTKYLHAYSSASILDQHDAEELEKAKKVEEKMVQAEEAASKKRKRQEASASCRCRVGGCKTRWSERNGAKWMYCDLMTLWSVREALEGRRRRKWTRIDEGP